VAKSIELYIAKPRKITVQPAKLWRRKYNLAAMLQRVSEA